jgi:hypothetical protein
MKHIDDGLGSSREIVWQAIEDCPEKSSDMSVATSELREGEGSLTSSAAMCEMPLLEMDRSRLEASHAMAVSRHGPT